jgi:predicted lipoprotein
MKNKTIKNKNKKNKKNKKRNKTKHVRFSKKLENYQTESSYNPIKIPDTSKCAEPAIEIKKALVSNILLKN